MSIEKKQKKIISRILLSLLTVIALIITGASFYMGNIYTPKVVLRIAVKENELIDKRYILCKEVVTTGFDWIMIKDEDGQKTNTLCNIVGANPFDDYNLKHEFRLAYNTFVFYIDEKNMVFSEATAQDELEYTVTGWDILYPVKQSELFAFDLFRSKKYIVENDCKRDSNDSH